MVIHASVCNKVNVTQKNTVLSAQHYVAHCSLSNNLWRISELQLNLTDMAPLLSYSQNVTNDTDLESIILCTN